MGRPVRNWRMIARGGSIPSLPTNFKMTPEQLQKTTVTRKNRDAYDRKKYPTGQKFARLGLTLSAKGWTASIQWEGTTGFRGEDKTLEGAIHRAIVSVQETFFVTTLS